MTAAMGIKQKMNRWNTVHSFMHPREVGRRDAWRTIILDEMIVEAIRCRHGFFHCVSNVSFSKLLQRCSMQKIFRLKDYGDDDVRCNDPLTLVWLLALQVLHGAWFRPKVSTDSARSDQIRVSKSNPISFQNYIMSAWNVNIFPRWKRLQPYRTTYWLWATMVTLLYCGRLRDKHNLPN